MIAPGSLISHYYHDMNAIKRKCPYLQDIELPKVKTDKVTVLFGTNHADVLVHQEYHRGKDGRTVLGELIVGGNKSNILNMDFNVIDSNKTDVLNENINKFWSIDSYGTIPKLQL